MGSSSSPPADANIILIFGSQTLDFNEESATQLRSCILETPALNWVSESILELPEHWNTIRKGIACLEDFPGSKYLDTLTHWLKTGKFPDGSFPLPNILLTPLVVITHLAQYSAILEVLTAENKARENPSALLNHKIETLGLCTGLLSAAAISSSVNRAQLQKYGAVVVRMAMAIGAFVDGNDVVEGEWTSFSVGWSSTEAGDQMSRILKDFPEVLYVTDQLGLAVF